MLRGFQGRGGVYGDGLKEKFNKNEMANDIKYVKGPTRYLSGEFGNKIFPWGIAYS